MACLALATEDGVLLVTEDGLFLVTEDSDCTVILTRIIAKISVDILFGKLSLGGAVAELNEVDHIFAEVESDD